MAQPAAVVEGDGDLRPGVPAEYLIAFVNAREGHLWYK